MRLKTALLGGLGLAVGIFLVVRSMSRPRRDLHLTTSDLDYPDLSPDDLKTEHLTDLNDAAEAQLQQLGLVQESVQRIIENRPYRSKLELVSRLVLTEAEYSTIRDKVGVTKGRDPVKVA